MKEILLTAFLLGVTPCYSQVSFDRALSVLESNRGKWEVESGGPQENNLLLKFGRRVIDSKVSSLNKLLEFLGEGAAPQIKTVKMYSNSESGSWVRIKAWFETEQCDCVFWSKISEDEEVTAIVAEEFSYCANQVISPPIISKEWYPLILK